MRVVVVVVVGTHRERGLKCQLFSVSVGVLCHGYFNHASLHIRNRHEIRIVLALAQTISLREEATKHAILQ